MARIVIFANGELKQSEIVKREIRSTDRIFCANGGTRHALSMGLRPEVIVGDLDSLAADLVSDLTAGGTKLLRYPEDKDQTDLELALGVAVAEKPEEILLVAALGGRLDQMLANILLLTRPEYGSVRLTITEGHQRASLLRGPLNVPINGRAGSTVSVIPLSPVVEQVTLTGVKWPLNDKTLTFGSTLTISNTLTDPRAFIRVGQGQVLLVQLDSNQET